MKAELIDSMGSDLSVVNSARVSFSKESEWDYIQSCCGNGSVHGCCGSPVMDQVLSEKDQKLIKYLTNHDHWTPFSHVMITMRETVPIFVARQRFKHMIGFTYNEVSRRYVDDPPEFYIPDKSKGLGWRLAPENMKQGSSGDAPVNTHFFANNITRLIYKLAEKWYLYLVNVKGLAPEQARMILPQGMLTSYYVTGSLAAWARAYKLRIDPHAQKEIQDLAKQWDDIISDMPELKYSWAALKS